MCPGGALRHRYDVFLFQKENWHMAPTRCACRCRREKSRRMPKSISAAIAIRGVMYQNTFAAVKIYGALVDGSAVCQGYAAAFNLMAGKCGLQSMAVCGRAAGVSHAWNYIKTGSKYRYIDCTWDDTGKEKISYQYFYVTEEKMREQHVWTAADFPAENIKYVKYF